MNSQPTSTEKYLFDNRFITLNWFDNDLPDTNLHISQVSAFCLYQGKLVLVKNKRGWSIPGGHPEVSETVNQTLSRELEEEACLKPQDYSSILIGWMKVEDPQNQGIEGKQYIQLRFLVRINNLPPFIPDDEIFDRTLINLDNINRYITWASSPTGQAQILTLKSHLI
ncbi:TPA: hypothetical protein DD455_02730 [Candidatus Shapirobacteria bacterium]|nr:hypothetical protein [Candidatus Shapirobacteria bacterium]